MQHQVSLTFPSIRPRVWPIVTVIKTVRDLFGLGLREAKDIVERGGTYTHTTYAEWDVERHEEHLATLQHVSVGVVITPVETTTGRAGMIRTQLVQAARSAMDVEQFGLARDILHVVATTTW